MSLLWPETIRIGLFPGHCWLQRGRGDAGLTSVALPSSAQPQELLAALSTMLSGQTPALRKGSRLQILVSDGMAAVVALPWQEHLSGEQEMALYAQACFEKQGMPVDADWTMQAGFRDHRAAGIAYALPEAWLRELLALLATRGLKLGSVLPVAASAYWRRARLPKIGQALLLLREPRRVTAMLYDASGWLGVDVEPVTSNETVSCTRLLRRVTATHSAINRVAQWDAAASADVAMSAVITMCLPEAELHQLDRSVWS